jgi:glycine dehydrogenase subunit 2
MKYNPKINESIARLPGFAYLHPALPVEYIQGFLQVVYELERYLAEISGMDAISLWPCAGAHGELTGIQIVRKYLIEQGGPRKEILIPDTAHGTNPATCTLNGYKIIPVKSNEKGVIDPGEIERVMNENIAGIMITNPNTLGLYEENFKKVSELIHARGGLVYCDGANMNAVMGKVQFGKIGADVMHFNLHKTFSTPHGGGGPGAGPVGVVKKLEPFLPIPRVVKHDDQYSLSEDAPRSIGRIRANFGNFGILLRAYVYIRELGARGLTHATEMAVLNANYIRACLKDTYHVPYDRFCMHECVLSHKHQKKQGVTTMDIAKRLIDYGFHPPTVFFPLIVDGALMIEPTESESKEQLDSFIHAMKTIAQEAVEDPDRLHKAPTMSVVRRVNDVQAARNPVLRWKAM